jgi:antirestriction protein ArdC
MRHPLDIGRSTPNGATNVKPEVYKQVTDRIVAMLESGTKPWQKSWSVDAPATLNLGAMQRPLRANGQAYRGVNVLNLWVAAQMRGLQSRHWMTYKGAQELGAQVRKGARGEFAFYVGQSTKPGENEGDDDKTFSFLKCYHVFNADEIEGLPPRFAPVAPPVDVPAPACPHARNATVDAFFADAGVRLAHGGNRAFYSPALDAVRMPELGAFNSAESYYATLAHEAVHWTGHESRCARPFGTRFGDDAYAIEELVAELGAAFLCADLAISDAPREDHASYLASWLKVLKADHKAIFTAASAADRAASFLHAAQPSAALLAA